MWVDLAYKSIVSSQRNYTGRRTESIEVTIINCTDCQLVLFFWLATSLRFVLPPNRIKNKSNFSFLNTGKMTIFPSKRLYWETTENWQQLLKKVRESILWTSSHKTQSFLKLPGLYHSSVRGKKCRVTKKLSQEFNRR